VAKQGIRFAAAVTSAAGGRPALPAADAGTAAELAGKPLRATEASWQQTSQLMSAWEQRYLAENCCACGRAIRFLAIGQLQTPVRAVQGWLEATSCNGPELLGGGHSLPPRPGHSHTHKGAGQLSGPTAAV